MGFTVPNGPDAGTADQAEPDALDYEALGYQPTGVVSGCAVTAQTVPDMTVAVSAGQVVVGGIPVAVGSGSVSIQTADANPRFDIIVADASGVKSAVRGTASATNPVFPDVDLASYALLASVYVGASTTSITNAALVDKRITLPTSLRRNQTSGTDLVIESNVGGDVFKVDAAGKTTWVESTLERIGTSAMELTASMRIKANDAITSLLTLRSRATSPENQKVLDIQNSGGTTVASVSGDGVLQAANFISGSGSPLNSVTASAGSLYIDVTTPHNKSLWISKGSGQWEPFRFYDPSDEGLPVGAISAFLGTVAPDGWRMLNGAEISTTDPETEELAALIGSTWGPATAGNSKLPDFRGLIPVGAGGDVAATLGDVFGTKEVTIGVDNLPVHDHPVTDPGHAHPAAGRAVYAPPAGSLKPSTDTATVTPFALAVEALNENHTAQTGITVGNTGSGTPIYTMPPSAAVNWVVKAHATYARISVFSAETLIPVNEAGETVYMTISEFQTALGL